jgi:hypothetical protein
MNKQIDEILQKRMDRKDFLKHVGMGVAIITGTAGIIKLLKPANGNMAKTNHGQHVAMGYGASAYGGHPATVAPKSL